jgi:hypothetical protein
MRWSHEIGDRGDPNWVFYSRRDPYVPEYLHASVFWSGLFVACVIWGLACVVCLVTLFTYEFTKNLFILCLYTFVFGLEIVNMVCFLKCHRVSTQQADDVARWVLLNGFDSDEMEPEQQQRDQTRPKNQD